MMIKRLILKGPRGERRGIYMKRSLKDKKGRVGLRTNRFILSIWIKRVFSNFYMKEISHMMGYYRGSYKQKEHIIVTYYS